MVQASNATPGRPRKRWMRWASYFGLGLILWGVAGRLTSPWRAVSIERVGRPNDDMGFDGAMRVACFNIAHARGVEADRSNWGAENRDEKLDAIGALLLREHVDLAVLNEVDFDATWSGHQHQAAAIAQAAGLPFMATQRNVDVSLPGATWRFGNAILSRYPIVDAKIVRMPAFSRFERIMAGNHDLLVAVLRLPDDSLVEVWAIHLESRDAPTRLRAAKRILAEIDASPHPVLLAGDFNSSPSSTASEETAMDLFLQSQRFQTFPDPAIGDMPATFSSLRPSRTIDWILAPSSWHISDASVQPDGLSDHLAVVATLGIAQDPIEPGVSADMP